MRFLLVALLLAGCGGGGSSDPSPVSLPGPVSGLPTARITDFNPVYETSGSAIAVVLDSRLEYWRYTWEPGRQHNGGGIGAENGSIRQCNGERWAWLDGYSNGPPGSLVTSTWATWPVDTVKADWTNLETGAVRDITAVCPALPYGGQAYIPFDIPPTGRYLIRVWGWIYEGPPPAPRGRRYYWQSEFTFGGSEFNPCWQGVNPTRPVIVQHEAWWDDNGWVRGQTVNLPWNGNVPADPGPAAYRSTHSIAAGAGILWSMVDENGTHACLQSATIR